MTTCADAEAPALRLAACERGGRSCRQCLCAWLPRNPKAEASAQHLAVIGATSNPPKPGQLEDTGLCTTTAEFNVPCFCPASLVKGGPPRPCLIGPGITDPGPLAVLNTVAPAPSPVTASLPWQAARSRAG